MTPEQLTASFPSPEKNIDALRTLAMKSYLEAKQSDDLRRDISARLQLSDGPFYPGDKIYYWTEDKSKVKSDGTHSGKWIKGKVISSDGSMVGIDLGTQILKVNISKVRKDINPIQDVEVPLDPVALLSSESARTDIPVTDHASSLVQSDGAQIGVEGFTYSCISYETSSKSHTSSLQNERFVRDFLQKSHVKSPKRAFRTRLPQKLTRQSLQKSSGNTHRSTHITQPCQAVSRFQPLQAIPAHTPIPM